MKFKSNVKDYLLHLKGFIDKETCEKTLKEMQNINYTQHLFYNPKVDKSDTRSGDKELDVSYDNVSTKKEIMNKLWFAIKQYQENLNYPWFQVWQGYSEIRLNKYSETKKMALHADHIHQLFEGKRKGIPILSVLGLLNDDFEGGEFIILDDQEIKFKQGDVLVFPSNLMFPHKVEPVTKGTRYSFISWVW